MPPFRRLIYGFSGRKAMRESGRCKHCKRNYWKNPRVKAQSYCGAKACQRARKTRWQRNRMRADSDYRENQKLSQKQWTASRPGYWQKYRQNHQSYACGNRMLQKCRDERRRLRHLAKMDALSSISSVKSGTYYLFTSAQVNLAKMDASGHKVEIISRGYG